MTAKEYLGQAYRLENKIRLQQRRIAELRELATSVSSPGFEEHYSATRNLDAPFVKTLERIMEYQEEADKRIVLLLDLREQIRTGIDEMESPDEALVIEHRYIYNMSWADIGTMPSSAFRLKRKSNRPLWHLEHPGLPIRDFLHRRHPSLPRQMRSVQIHLLLRIIKTHL